MASWPPTWITPVSEREKAAGDGRQANDFINGFCRVTKDSIAGRAGSPMRLRGWQQELNSCLLARRADNRLKHRRALIGMPRKNGKSSLLSPLMLYLLLFGPEGGEVYAVASSRDQARIVFGTVKRMVQLNPELDESLNTFKDVIEDPVTGSVIRVLAAEAPQLEGLIPHAVCYDELHTAPNRELWDVLSLASGSRREPLMIGITTAGVKYDSRGRDTLCYDMYNHGIKVANGEIEDPSFFMAWWGVRGQEVNWRDPDVWREANPGFGDIVDPEDFEASAIGTPESEFKTKRLNMFVDKMTAWLPEGAWDAIGDGEPIPDGEPVVLAFDGSLSNDSTAIVAVQISTPPRIATVAVWERPPNAPPEWSVPIIEVEDTIRQACARWDVKEVSADPFRWARSLEILAAEGIPIEQFPQSPARMTPATERFYEATVQRQLVHDSNPAMARHMASAVLKNDSRGSRIVKETKASLRKIDLAVCAIMGLDRAAWWAQNRPKARRVVSF